MQRSGKAVLNRISSMSAHALRTTAILEESSIDGVWARANLADGRVKVVRYRARQIELNVESNGNGFLVIANTWSPFWRAMVDGRERTLVRTNHTQLGMSIEPGSHDVTLAYQLPYRSALYVRD
jgi:hypothetical protein